MSENSKIIFLIHKIDAFIDPKLNQPSNIAFWLPKTFPSRVKMIATCDKNSETMQYFLKTGCTLLDIKTDKIIGEFMLTIFSNKEFYGEIIHKEKILNRFLQLDEKLKTNPKFIKIYMQSLIPDNEDKDWKIIFKNFNYENLLSKIIIVFIY